jgi:hypothetical protein
VAPAEEPIFVVRKFVPKTTPAGTLPNLVVVAIHERFRLLFVPAENSVFLKPVLPPPGDPTQGCGGGNSVYTAIGCIPVLGSREEFLGWILKWAVGIGGGIAFLLIVYAGFIIMTAAGNPERIKAGQELLTSAISGLIMLIFSIFILRVIGVDILKITGFGT